MQNAAMWLASIFGPFLVILGLWMLLYCDQYTKVLNGIKGSAGLFYMNSVFNLLIGFTVLSQYDLWGWNLLVLVTILGWVMVIRGIMGLFVPQLLIDIMMGKHGFSKVMGIIPLVWGVFLSYVGFFI
ncbi:MAG: hypothetical protein KBA81_04830 [Rhabdochlamydiaceae bacterium]|jgi:hypothetical protein|nr:hypothetical protein [Rhabdochlamydiaceae bacterium]